MKNIFNYVLIIAALLMGGACSEEFLETTPEQNVDIKDAIRDIKSLRTTLNGIYSNLQDPDLFGRTLPLLPDVMADNAKISVQNANRYNPQNEYRVVATDGFTTSTWEDLYEVVVNANNIVDRFPEAEFLASEQTEADHRLGEAYALRAFAYFNLVRFFAQPYNFTNDASHPGVILIVETTGGEIISPPRATVKQVYDAMVSDLQQAIGLMTLNENGRFSKEGAKALLAKIYLYMGNWSEAERLATEVIDSGRFTLYNASNFVSSWSADFGSESIFEIQNTPVDNAGFDALSYFFSQAGYGDGLATDNLYEAYSETDVRRQLILKGKRTNGEDPAYIIMKYPNQTSASDDNFKAFRLAEMYLIRAEARAEQGKEDLALADLNTIAQRVDPEAAAIDVKGDALIDAILDERRKELAFEGDRLYDLTRRKKSFTKFLSDRTIDVAYPSDKTIAPIPQSEVDANANVVQNPGYGQ